VCVLSVVGECRELLDRLRLLKSDLEGSNYAAFSPAPLDSSAMSQLKHLVRSHTPANLPEEQKAKIANQLADLLAGRVKQLLYACLLTCPWYSEAQTEESSKANRNVVFVVYVALNEQFFSLTTPHNKAMMETADHVCWWQKFLLVLSLLLPLSTCSWCAVCAGVHVHL